MCLKKRKIIPVCFKQISPFWIWKSNLLICTMIKQYLFQLLQPKTKGKHFYMRSKLSLITCNCSYTSLSHFFNNLCLQNKQMELLLSLKLSEPKKISNTKLNYTTNTVNYFSFTYTNPTNQKKKIFNYFTSH